MIRNVAAVAVCLVLGACVSNPLPEGYTGPRANISDSFIARGNSSANFFFVASVDGKRIDNALSLTTQNSAGQGFFMRPSDYTRPVPAQIATFTITGLTHYAAPILALTSTVYKVSGDIRFAPLPDHNYAVKGVLGPDYSAVWIEDTASGSVIDHKVEIKGSAAQGFFEK